MSKRLLAAGLAAIACLGLPAAAIAQDKRCISRAESQAVVAHLMPNLLTSTAKRCGTSLGATSYLVRDGSRLATKMTPQAQANWPAAKRALERQSGTALPDNPALLDFGRQAIADGVANKMDANGCRMVDQLLEQLAPLPAANLSRVFALFLEAGVNNSKEAAFRICDAQTG